jgi:hypothetical protein
MDGHGGFLLLISEPQVYQRFAPCGELRMSRSAQPSRPEFRVCNFNLRYSFPQTRNQRARLPEKMDEKREMLRHALATLAYRTARAIENAPLDFGGFEGAGRKPVQILAHMGDLLVWSLSMALGSPALHDTQPLDWHQEEQRFFRALASFDALLASNSTLHAPVERLLQGPVVDALTHTGQLAMLRRLAGAPTRGENFYVAAISVGQVGSLQPAPVKPF